MFGSTYIVGKPYICKRVHGRKGRAPIHNDWLRERTVERVETDLDDRSAMPAVFEIADPSK